MFSHKDPNFLHHKFTSYLSRHAHFLAIAETKLNATDYKQTNNVTSSFNLVSNGGLIRTHNTPNFFNSSNSQPGGVLAGFYGKLHQRHQSTGYDPFGRWMWHQFVGGNGIVRIYTFYRVVHSYDEQSGLTTAWSQQRRELKDHGILTNPRQQAITDICKDIQKAIDSDISIILLTDLNEGINDSEKKHQKFQNLGLCNLMEERIGTGLPATRIPGSKAIDHVYISSTILPHVQQAGFAPLRFFDFSDHRAIVMDIDFHSILDKDLVTLKNGVHRRLNTAIPIRMEKYVKYIEKEWKYHNIHQRIEKLNDPSLDVPALTSLLHTLDNQITQIMNAAEKRCSKVPRNAHDAWSSTLHNAIQNIWECRYQIRELHRKAITDVTVNTLSFQQANEALVHEKNRIY